MIKNNYFLITLNAVRTYEERIKHKTKKIFPEYENICKYFIYMYIITQICIISVIMLLDFQNNYYLRDLINNYLKEFILTKFILELIILNNISRFSIPKKMQMIYGVSPSIFYILCSNFKHFYTIFFLQIIYLKTFDIYISIPLIGITCIIIYSFLYGKLINFKYNNLILRLIVSLGIIIIICSVSNKIFSFENIGIHITKSQILLFLGIIFAYVCMYILGRKNIARINNTSKIFTYKYFNQYMRLLTISVFNLSTIMIITNLSIFINIEYPLIILSFLLTSLLIKIRFVHFLTVESFGFFLFYIKNLNRAFQQTILKNIQINNYLLLFPILIIHELYLLLNSNFTFAGILLVLYLIDIKIDELVIYISRKVEKKKEILNLFIYSKKGLSSVLLIALFPVTIISYIIKNSHAFTSSTWIYILITLSILYIFMFYITHIWKNNFFKDLYK